MMCSVNSQIQRAISDAISNQILPQIQSALSAGSGHSTQNRWNVPSERPEVNSEGLQNINPKDGSASKPNCNRQNDGVVDPNAYDKGNLKYCRTFDRTILVTSSVSKKNTDEICYH